MRHVLHIHSHKGFTLVEVVLVVAMMAILITAVSAFQRDFFRLNSSFQQSLLRQQEAQSAMEQMVREVRSAGTSDNGAFVIESADGTSLTFYSNEDGDSARERIHYFLNGTTLKKGVVEPTGSPPVYNPANEVVKSLVRDIGATTTPLFTYYDQSYAGTSTPLAEPIDLLSVRFVKIMLPIDRDPTLPPEALIIESQAALRNLKDN